MSSSTESAGPRFGDADLRTRLGAWVATWGRDAIPFACFAGLALVLRLIELRSKAMHHDESLHATFGWRIVSGDGYSYDPVYHGPLNFYLIALSDLVFGASDFVSRLPYALSGTAIVFLPFFVRRQLGTVATLTASAALCLAPSYLYYSRFAREDIHIATLNLALLVAIIRFLDAPRRWQPAVFLGLLAAAFATKETTYITVFYLGLFTAGLIVVQGVQAARDDRRSWDGPFLKSARSLGASAWAWGVSTFLVVFTLLFSGFLTNPSGLKEGLVGSIDYWLSQQPVARGGQPWFYYLVLLPAYEWPIILLGVVGIVVVLRRPTVVGALLLWTFVASLAIFSWASERMPWLVLHPLLPLILLAGVGMQALWTARARRWSQVAIVLVAVTGVGWVYQSIQLSYLRPEDPRELLVQVQSSQDVPKVRDEIMRIRSVAARRSREPLVMQVDSWGGTGWPWSWYLRDVPTGYYDMSHPEVVDPGAVVLVADPNHAVMAPRLTGYVAERFRLRVWWVPDWGSVGVGDWLRWLAFRTPWSPTATMDEWIYLRPDVAKMLEQERG